MPLADAITEIEGRLSNPRDRMDVTDQGMRPSQAVYRSGIRINNLREFVHYVTIEFHNPATASFVSNQDIDVVYDLAEDMLGWLANATTVGGMYVWWDENPLNAVMDYSEEATATITIGLCEQYPRA